MTATSENWIIIIIIIIIEKTSGVSHCGLTIYIKNILRQKEEFWKFKY
jgi:hypothetical protein